MKLLEYKGKELLKKSGITVPPSIVVNNHNYINLSFHKEKYTEFFFQNLDVVIKAQVIGGKRKKNKLIVTSNDFRESLKLIDELYKQKFNNASIKTLLIEKKLNIKEEYFLSIQYHNDQILILFSKEGGIDIEELSKKHKPVMYYVPVLEEFNEFKAREVASLAGFETKQMLQVANFVKKAYDCFINYDCKSLEINPIIKTKEGLLFAGDAKITIDDSAVCRLDEFKDVQDLEDTSFLNERELEARRIDLNDHRGVAGKTYVDFDGDIAVLASGGGASLTCMDAILEAGGKPANYVEYSGNPPKEKVRKLSKIVLSKPGLKGCLIIGGSANFTDIYETLSGIAESIKEVNPKYPIVIRRDGPKRKEAFEMMEKFAKDNNYDITLFDATTPMTKAVLHLMEKLK
tara:strand:+ start:55 stop:1263 length:1209 start_codon:yes stop_codon:yes gene_type:complete